MISRISKALLISCALMAGAGQHVQAIEWGKNLKKLGKATMTLGSGIVGLNYLRLSHQKFGCMRDILHKAHAHFVSVRGNQSLSFRETPLTSIEVGFHEKNISPEEIFYLFGNAARDLDLVRRYLFAGVGSLTAAALLGYYFYFYKPTQKNNTD